MVLLFSNSSNEWHHLTEAGQSKHAVELPFLGVPDDVGGVAALLGAMEQRPPEVSLTQQAEHTQLPVDLQRRRRRNTHVKKTWAHTTVYGQST